MAESPIAFLCWRLPESVHKLRRREGRRHRLMRGGKGLGKVFFQPG